MIHAPLDFFAEQPWWAAAVYLTLANVGVFFLSLFVGEILVRKFTNRRVTPAPPPPLERAEVLWAISCVVLNSAVAFAGWVLWRKGIVVVRRDLNWRVALDVLVLLVAMDFLMYVFHRIAHLPWIYPFVHSTHHRYDNPRPLNLFVLNPFEVLGFGALWLIVISVYPVTWVGMLAYLALNLAFGTLGHLGVEPYPVTIGRWPVLRHLGSSTFHADHHQNARVNFGFYTDIWDRLFRTTRPDRA